MTILIVEMLSAEIVGQGGYRGEFLRQGFGDFFRGWHDDLGPRGRSYIVAEQWTNDQPPQISVSRRSGEDLKVLSDARRAMATVGGSAAVVRPSLTFAACRDPGKRTLAAGACVTASNFVEPTARGLRATIYS